MTSPLSQSSGPDHLPSLGDNQPARDRAYDAWLHWIVTDICNLSCKFCIAAAPNPVPAIRRPGQALSALFRVITTLHKTPGVTAQNWIASFYQKAVSRLARERNQKESLTINIPALIKTLDKTGRIFRIGFTGGGEPFIIKNLVDACEAVTQKHFISINTNLTSPKVLDFCKRVNPKHVVHLHTSPHIQELERRNLMDTFFNYYHACKEAGFNVAAGEVAYPPLAGQAKAYQELFRNKGVDLIFVPFIGDYQGRHYPDSYTSEEIEQFGLKPDAATTGTIFNHKGQPCNAGYNIAFVEPNGDIKACHQMQNLMGNVYQKIEFRKDILKCPFETCYCPLFYYDAYLYQRALQETGHLPG